MKFGWVILREKNEQQTIVITIVFQIVLSLVYIYITGKLLLKASKPSVDHYGHLSLIQDFKLNNHRFINGYSNVVEMKNFAYPTLFHFLLSFLPYTVSEKSYFRINLFVDYLLWLSGLGIIVYFLPSINLKIIGLASLLLATNPFGKFLWNAKVSGLSARNFGILTIYGYLFYFSSSAFNDFFYLKAAGFILIGFIVILSSQFATQFLLLFAIINLFFKNYLPALALPFSFLLFYLVLPKIFLSYVRGQFEHKKIWIKHLAKIDLLKKRYSVYRDFVYDFYKKRDLKYFFSNPVAEVLTGFPMLVALVYIHPDVFLTRPVIAAAVICFFITSFRFSRFFGEPQRYIEMALPALVFAAMKYLSVEQLYGVVVFNIIFFLIHFNIFATFNTVEIFSEEKRNSVKDKINAEDASSILAGNNWSMPGYFLPEKNMKIILPTFTAWEQYGTTIDKMFPNDLFSLDMNVAVEWIKNYKVTWFFLDKYYWPQVEFEKEMNAEGIRFIFKNDLHPVLLYQIFHD